MPFWTDRNLKTMLNITLFIGMVSSFDSRWNSEDGNAKVKTKSLMSSQLEGMRQAIDYLSTHMEKQEICSIINFKYAIRSPSNQLYNMT